MKPLQIVCKDENARKELKRLLLLLRNKTDKSNYESLVELIRREFGE